MNPKPGLKNHINVHYTRFDCLKCGALFINKIAAELHMKNEHSDGITDCEVGKIRLESLVGLSRCDKCGGEFRSCAELTQHKETQVFRIFLFIPVIKNSHNITF